MTAELRSWRGESMRSWKTALQSREMGTGVGWVPRGFLKQVKLVIYE
jgi:hypothetical protein